MPVKKTDPKTDTTSKVVEVTVPAVPGIALNDIYRTALTSVRDEIPLVSDLVYSIDSTEKHGEERIYKVRIAWGPRDPAQQTDDDTVGQALASLEVPTALPTNIEGDDKR